MPENVSLCEVAVTFPSGGVPPKFRLQWNQDERAGSYSLPAWRSKLILLPTGFVDLTPFALGCEQSRVRVEVGPNDRVTPIRLVLRAAQ